MGLLNAQCVAATAKQQRLRRRQRQRLRRNKALEQSCARVSRRREQLKSNFKSFWQWKLTLQKTETTTAHASLNAALKKTFRRAPHFSLASPPAQCMSKVNRLIDFGWDEATRRDIMRSCSLGPSEVQVNICSCDLRNFCEVFS